MNEMAANSALVKVPVIITLFFWIIKILATTVGETGADFLIFNLHFGLPATSALMGVLLAGFLFVQVKAKRYILHLCAGYCCWRPDGGICWAGL